MPFSINGIGTSYFGECDFRSDGSYITTEFISVVYIPILPFRSLRVMRLPEGDTNLVVYSSAGFLLIERIPLHWKQVWNIYGFLGFLALAWTAILQAPELFGSSWGNVPFPWIFATLFPLLGLPCLLPVFLRSRARKKVTLTNEALANTLRTLKSRQPLR